MSGAILQSNVLFAGAVVSLPLTCAVISISLVQSFAHLLTREGAEKRLTEKSPHSVGPNV